MNQDKSGYASIYSQASSGIVAVFWILFSCCGEFVLALGCSPVEGAKALLCESFPDVENAWHRCCYSRTQLLLLGLSELMYVLGSATCDQSHLIQ